MRRASREDMKRVSQASKENLIAKIKFLQKEATASIQELNTRFEEIVKSIRANLQDVRTELETFINYCEKCVEYINSINLIQQNKLFFLPLEQILISNNPNLDNFKGPELSIEDSYSRPFRLYLPTVAHLLFNYNWTISLEDDKIFVLGPKVLYNYEEFKQDIDSTTRYLIVSESKILFAGGVSWRDFTAYIDIQNNKARVLAKLNTGRYKHSLAWIDGQPAVLGGVSENGEILSLVEIFVDNEWKVHSNMTQKRCNLTAVNCLQKVFVIGGSSDHEGKHPYATIEVWKTSWSLIEVTLPCPMCNLGVVNSGDSVLLIGGKNLGHEGTAVYRMNLAGAGWKRLTVFNDFIFKNNSVVVAHSFVKGKCYNKQKSDVQIVVDFNVLTMSIEICKRYQ